MAEAIQSPLKTRVAAHPVLAMKLQSENCPEYKSAYDPKPPHDQIDLDGVRFHVTNLAEADLLSLIEKISRLLIQAMSRRWRETMNRKAAGTPALVSVSRQS